MRLHHLLAILLSCICSAAVEAGPLYALDQFGFVRSYDPVTGAVGTPVNASNLSNVFSTGWDGLAAADGVLYALNAFGFVRTYDPVTGAVGTPVNASNLSNVFDHAWSDLATDVSRPVPAPS